MYTVAGPAVTILAEAELDFLVEEVDEGSWVEGEVEVEECLEDENDAFFVRVNVEIAEYEEWVLVDVGFEEERVIESKIVVKFLDLRYSTWIHLPVQLGGWDEGEIICLGRSGENFEMEMDVKFSVIAIVCTGSCVVSIVVSDNNSRSSSPMRLVSIAALFRLYSPFSRPLLLGAQLSSCSHFR